MLGVETSEGLDLRDSEITSWAEVKSQMLTQGTPGVLVNEGFEQIHEEQESRGDGEDNENTK